MMDIKIDEKLVRDVVAGAIMNSLSQEQRNTLITNAIAHLMTPPKPTGSYGKPEPSPLESAFNFAMGQEARRIANEMLEKDESVHAQIKALIVEAMEALVTKDRAGTVDRIARAIETGITKDRY